MYLTGLPKFDLMGKKKKIVLLSRPSTQSSIVCLKINI